MKTVSFVIVFIFLLGLVIPKTFAATSVNIQDNGNGSSSNVHVENSVGQNTTCVNGNCSTTSNGNNSATVCINGNCTTSPDGNIERKEDGATVHVENHSSSSSTQSPTPSGQDSSQTAPLSPVPTDMTTTTPSASPSVVQRQEKHAPNQQLQSQPMSLEEMINKFEQFIFSFIPKGK